MNNKLKRNAKNLANNTLESYYWLGFLMADGYVGTKNNIRFTLSIKDESQLLKFREFLKIKNKLEYVTQENIVKYVTFSINDIETCKFLRDSYNITNNKTINPPDLSLVLDEPNIFLSFFIGMFDGDGCVSHKNNIPNILKIECHNNWHNNLKSIQCALLNHFNINSTLRVTKKGYSKLSICRYKDFVKIKQFIIEFNIPAMNRKWDMVDINRDYRGKSGKGPKEKRLPISYYRPIEYLNQIKSVKEWSQIFNIPVDTLRMRLSRGWLIEKALIKTRI